MICTQSFLFLHVVSKNPASLSISQMIAIIGDFPIFTAQFFPQINCYSQLNLPRLKPRGSQPKILMDSDTLGYPRSSYGSCICYTPTIRSPSFRIFIAAFTSLSWTAPHCGQAQFRTDKSLVSICL